MFFYHEMYILIISALYCSNNLQKLDFVATMDFPGLISMKNRRTQRTIVELILTGTL